MGFRLRRTLRLFPGVRLNVSTGGVSVSAGVPGLTANLSHRGVRTTVSAPGTGLSYSTLHGATRRLSAREIAAAERRAEVEARREAALADADAEEAELEQILDSWREVPPLPGREALEAELQPEPFVSYDVPAPTPPVLAAPAQPSVEGSSVVPLLALGACIGVTLPIEAVAVSLAPTAAPVVALGTGLTLAFAATVVAVLGALRARSLVAGAPPLPEPAPSPWPAYYAELHAWEAARDAARDAFDRAEADRAHRARRVANGELLAVEEAIGWAISDLSFPFEAECRFEVPEPTTAYVLVDLPEIEDLIPETRVKVLKDGSTKEVRRTRPERLAGYARLACGLPFLLARTVFAAAPTVQTVHVAGYTQRRQKRTGEIDDDFVYEVAIARAVSAGLPHAVMDPVATIQALPGRIKRADSGELGRVAGPVWTRGLGTRNTSDDLRGRTT